MFLEKPAGAISAANSAFDALTNANGTSIPEAKEKKNQLKVVFSAGPHQENGIRTQTEYSLPLAPTVANTTKAALLTASAGNYDDIGFYRNGSNQFVVAIKKQSYIVIYKKGSDVFEFFDIFAINATEMASDIKLQRYAKSSVGFTFNYLHTDQSIRMAGINGTTNP